MKDKTLCIFPLCTRKAVHDELCFLHKIYSKKDVVKSGPAKIQQLSDKRKDTQKEYVKIVKEMLAENPYCEIKSPVCTGKAQGLDHTQKRSPSNLLNRKNLKRSCNPCQDFKERFPEWAKENGHSISRFENIKPFDFEKLDRDIKEMFPMNKI